MSWLDESALKADEVELLEYDRWVDSRYGTQPVSEPETTEEDDPAGDR